MIIKKTLASFCVFMLIIISIITSVILIFHATSPILADELMPYDLLGQNDSFKIVLNVNELGYISAVTYSYEFAN